MGIQAATAYLKRVREARGVFCLGEVERIRVHGHGLRGDEHDVRRGYDSAGRAAGVAVPVLWGGLCVSV